MATKPIFLFSLPRSGSTLLQRMLSCHDKIQTHSELWFLLPHIDALRNRYFRSIYGARSLGDATKGLLTQLPGGEDDYFDALRKMSDAIYEKLAIENERYVLDKTPRYYFFIPEIRKLYPDAKFVFLFRNPLSVAGSLVSSFNRGKLGDCFHRVDLFEGPKMLAAGYKSLDGEGIALKYEDLVTDPEQQLRKLCGYLELSYQPDMIKDFANVPVGVMGDQFGSKRHQSVSDKSVEKWREVFGTRYRRKFLEKLLNYLGPETVQGIGYEFDVLKRDVQEMEVRSGLSLGDRYREIQCTVYSFLEIPYLKDKIFRRVSTLQSRYIHQ